MSATEGMSAVLRTAAAVGLDVDPRRVTVLRERANLVVHLTPHAVVARTPHWTALVRPEPLARLGLEVGLSRWAAGRGGAVVQPCAGELAGPHLVGDLVVTLWPWVRADPAPADPVAHGRALAALHASLVGYPGRLPGPEEIAAYSVRAWRLAGEAGAVSAEAVVVGEQEVAEVLAGLEHALAALAADRLVPLHGDAHHGNAVLVDGTVTWWDLEDAWRGPVEWDVVVMASVLGDDADAAVDAYRGAAGVVLDAGLMDLCARLREVQARAWGALVRAVQTRP